MLLLHCLLLSLVYYKIRIPSKYMFYHIFEGKNDMKIVFKLYRVTPLLLVDLKFDYVCDVKERRFSWNKC